MTWRAMLVAIRRELATPSPADEGWYRWSVIAMGHALIGAAWVAAFALLFGDGWRWVGAVMGGCLYFAKERGDRIHRGGRTADGVNDIAFVGLGLTYQGPVWWPLVILLCVGFGAAWRVLREGRE